MIKKGHVIELEHPVKLDGGATLGKLTVEVEALTVGDELAANAKSKGDDALFEFHLATKVFGINPEDLIKVNRRDWPKAAEVLANF